MPPHPAGTGGPEGAGLPARQAQPPGRGARPGGRHSGRGWSGASAGHSDDGGQAGVAIPISLVGPPRRGEARQRVGRQRDSHAGGRAEIATSSGDGLGLAVGRWQVGQGQLWQPPRWRSSPRAGQGCRLLPLAWEGWGMPPDSSGLSCPNT